MTGKRYYLTTIGDWKRRASSFANSHWFLLDATHVEPGGVARRQTDAPPENGHANPDIEQILESTLILALIEADEGTHGALEDDCAFDALPHPLSQKPISDAAQSALAAHGVAPGTSTFDATEVIARVHPLLRHRVF